MTVRTVRHYCIDCDEETEQVCAECGCCDQCCDCVDGLFDADELGLDPEDDYEYRRRHQ